jgi:hypothetical protein
MWKNIKKWCKKNKGRTFVVSWEICNFLAIFFPSPFFHVGWRRACAVELALLAVTSRGLTVELPVSCVEREGRDRETSESEREGGICGGLCTGGGYIKCRCRVGGRSEGGSDVPLSNSLPFSSSTGKRRKKREIERERYRKDCGLFSLIVAIHHFLFFFFSSTVFDCRSRKRTTNIVRFLCVCLLSTV